VGGTESISVDVRVLAATNRDLRQAVEDRSFRQDLFYRLNVITLTIPPLRERKEDIPLLVESILERLSVEMSKKIEGVSSEAMGLLMGHDWPGNVRELRNVLERASVVSTGPYLHADHLGLYAEPGTEGPARASSLHEVEKRHIDDVLRQTSGNVTQAARILEIDRATLYAKIRKYGLRRYGDLEPADAERS